MIEEKINELVNKAYYNLTGIAKTKSTFAGEYLLLIIPNEYINNTDEILNKLFQKFCIEINKNISLENLDIQYKSFCNNNPSKELINDCFKLIQNIIINEKSSNEATLYRVLDSLKPIHSEQELKKSFNTVFDILLDYYTITNK